MVDGITWGWGPAVGASCLVRWIDTRGAHGMARTLPPRWRPVARHPRYPTSILMVRDG